MQASACVEQRTWPLLKTKPTRAAFHNGLAKTNALSSLYVNKQSVTRAKKNDLSWMKVYGQFGRFGVGLGIHSL